MTDLVNPSPNRAISASITAATIQRAAHAPNGGWIVPDDDSVIEASPLNAFAPEQSSGDLTVQIDSGEAIVGGVYLGRDTTTDVTLDASEGLQSVFVGADLSQPDAVIVGLADDFASGDPRIPIAAYETDSSSVTDATDTRIVGRQVDVQNRRYEGNGAGSVTNADSAAALANRSATTLVRDNRTATLPVGKIPSDDRSRAFEYVPGDLDLKLLGTSLIAPSGTVPTDVYLQVLDESETVSYQTTSRRTSGTLDQPLLTLGGEQAPVTFRIQNDSSNSQRVGAMLTYILE
ncbi:hypothetical protein ACFPYI_01840 [Halomarina salina]|uniref:Uncharacterized protein n=1 Tax=Halomarina salina TaxID=1872699 RepID=A0ABD5RHM2_9EURY|nr:hypothetical protein [Halomarina salina]